MKYVQPLVAFALVLSLFTLSASAEEAGIDQQISELEQQIKALKDMRESLGNTSDDAEDSKAEPAPEPEPKAKLTRRQQHICDKLGLDPDRLATLIARPLYKFNESDVDFYLRYLSAAEPELPKRIAHLARKNIGQPYEIYLLGEMPFEHYDPQPIYCLDRSDCLVFTEHTYAMALSSDWPGFIRMLQRIRYKDGVLGVATRNHYTESDWNPSNAWLVRDITEELARNKTVHFKQKVDRARFLQNRYGLATDIPVQEAVHTFIRFEDIDMAKPRLRDGDFVNFVRGRPPKPSNDDSEDGESRPQDKMEEIFGGSAWVGHTGMIVLGDNGEVNLIHSARPSVREESIDDYIANATKNLAERDAQGKARLLGFKFLRLRKDPWGNLREIDGEQAPKVILPGGKQFD